MGVETVAGLCLDGAVADLMAITVKGPSSLSQEVGGGQSTHGTGSAPKLRCAENGCMISSTNLLMPAEVGFSAFPRSFDGRGNYSLGLREQLVFPEIDYDKIDKIRGMDIVIVTTAKTDEEGYELLRALGMPFRSA